MAEYAGKIVSVTPLPGAAALGGVFPVFLTYSGASLIRRLPPKRDWDTDPVVYNGAILDVVRDWGVVSQKALIVSPADAAEDIGIAATLVWQDGGYADCYDVYVGTDPASLVLVEGPQDATFYAADSDWSYETVYYWRIDSKNNYGTTTGDVWSFTTEDAPPTLAPLIGQWTFPVTERLEFFTEVLAGHDRTEQRIAHRCDATQSAIPSQSFSTQLLVRGEDAASRLDAILHGWLKKWWPVPLWPQARLHTAPLAAGSTVIAIDTRDCDYRAKGYAILWQSDAAYEVVHVLSIADAALTLDDPLVGSFSGPKWVMPCRRGWLVQGGAVHRHAGGVLVDLTWEIDATDLAAVTGYAAGLEYDGMTVLTEAALRSDEAMDASHDADITVLGGSTGPFVVVSNSLVDEVTQSHGWYPFTLAEAWSLRQFLHAMKGRQGAFLVPTFRNDLVLTRAAALTDTSLYVANRGIADNMGFNALRTYLAFRPAGSAMIVRKVTGITEVDGAEEKIDLGTAPGVGFAAGTILCWVDKCRLASDTITIDWHRRGACACTVQLVRVT